MRLAFALAFPLLIATTTQADWITKETCIPGAPGPKAGVVTALTGEAWAQSERCGALERRPLLCGSVLFEDDHVVTGAGGNVAFEIEQSQVYVGPDSDLRVATGADGAPDLLLVGGRVRVVDPDDVVGPDRRLATPDLVSVGRGDTEAIAGADVPSSICVYARAISVGDASHPLAPGSCAGPVFVASDVAGLGVSLVDAGRCDYADAGDFVPTDVAAGPPPQRFLSPLVPPPPPPVCQGGTCTSVNPGPPTPPVRVLRVIESPAVNEPPPL
jgi:hypothetical protein